MTHYAYQPVVEITRGEIVESVVYGAGVIVDASGRLVYRWGDPFINTYLRSSAKPFQVLPFVERGGVEHFGLTEEELAILCASHSGTDEHVRVVSGIQAKVGVTESHLMCGIHPPEHKETARAMMARGEQPTQNRHNCSGKHTGMLAHAKLRGFPTDNYIDIHHPVQQTILQTFSEMVDVPVDHIHLGTDGCSAPVFAVPLYQAALGFARLADPTGLAPERAAACRKITHAMAAHGFMVAGPGRFDTDVMAVGNGMIVTKAGAEGYQGMALLPGALGKGSPALGIAFKISDGDQSGRSRPTVAVEVLRQLGALNDTQLTSLADHRNRPQYNWRKIEIGAIRACLQLEKLP